MLQIEKGNMDNLGIIFHFPAMNLIYRDSSLEPSQSAKWLQRRRCLKMLTNSSCSDLGQRPKNVHVIWQRNVFIGSFI